MITKAEKKQLRYEVKQLVKEFGKDRPEFRVIHMLCKVWQYRACMHEIKNGPPK